MTPVGDPPLLMGFMWGVGFFWSLHILPIMLLNTVLLLGLFYFMDKRAYKRDVEDGDKPGKPKEKTPVHLTGGHNIIFLAMIVLAIILSGMLPDIVPFFGREVKIYGEVSLTVASIMESVVILLAAFLSFKTTKKEVRVSNNFTWGPISEVAVLFIGIFITMIPAILILEAKGSSLGITQPWQFFWCTGLLSSFLDNTPTYMVFFATAASLGLTDGSLIATSLGMIPQVILAAVSAGAVFMGAVTYIGNAPNFMVRSIAEENGINMPSFFKYIIWSVSCLFPVFLIDTILFFL